MIALSSLSPEAQVFLLVAGPEENDAHLARRLGGELDWERLCALSLRANAVAAVWNRLERLGTGRAPPAAAAHFRQLAMIGEFRQAQLEQRFLEVTNALAVRGIATIALKGAALAVEAYGSFRERAMHDLDLLVDRGRAEEAHSLLQQAGWEPAFPLEGKSGVQRQQLYESHHHLPPLVDGRGSGFAIEIHTDLFPAGNPFALSTDELWQNSRTVEYRQREIRVLGRTDQLLHLCLHFAWSHVMRGGGWRTFRDLRAIMASGPVDWAAFAEAAETSRGSTCCYWTLRLARNLAGIGVPDGVLRLLRPPLPELVLQRVEYHLAHEMLPPEAICPSHRLRDAVWEVAILPGRSGHGRSRPWHHQVEVTGQEGASVSGLRARMSVHLQRLNYWRHYLAGMVAPGAGPAQSSPRANRA